MKKIAIIIVLLLSFNVFFAQETQSLQVKNSIENTKAGKILVFENDNIQVHFNTKGGKIYAYYFKKYKEKKTNKMLNIIDTDYFAHPIEFEGLPFDINHIEYNGKILKNGVVFTKEINGFLIEKKYLFNKDKYFCNVVLKITNNTTTPLKIKDLEAQWGPDMKSQETSKTMRSRYEGSFYYNGKKVKRHVLRKKLDINIEDFDWIGFHTRYFAVVLLKNNDIVRGEIFKDTHYKVWFSGHFAPTTIAPKESKTFKLTYYVGPQSIFILKKHGHNLNKIINLGFFGFLTKFFIIFLAFLFKLVHNYGIAIIIITILIKLILLPLSNSSIKSMRKMAELQPELQKLQKLYKDNPQKLNEETMKLYKTFKVNPLGGCLPLFIQLPFFWAIYQAFSVSIDLRNAYFFWWIKDLSAPDTVFKIIGIPINILPILMGIAMFIQQELQGTQQSTSSQNKWMKFMPFLFLIFFWNLPSGLVLYWLTNNILTIIQTIIIYKKNEKEKL